MRNSLLNFFDFVSSFVFFAFFFLPVHIVIRGNARNPATLVDMGEDPAELMTSQRSFEAIAAQLPGSLLFNEVIECMARRWIKPLRN